MSTFELPHDAIEDLQPPTQQSLDIMRTALDGIKSHATPTLIRQASCHFGDGALPLLSCEVRCVEEEGYLPSYQATITRPNGHFGAELSGSQHPEFHQKMRQEFEPYILEHVCFDENKVAASWLQSVWELLQNSGGAHWVSGQYAAEELLKESPFGTAQATLRYLDTRLPSGATLRYRQQEADDLYAENCFTHHTDIETAYIRVPSTLSAYDLTRYYKGPSKLEEQRRLPNDPEDLRKIPAQRQYEVALNEGKVKRFTEALLSAEVELGLPTVEQ